MSERCYVCERIDINTFYRELRRDLGCKAEDARQIIALVRTVYVKNPILLCGKKRGTIKAAFAYVGSIAFGYPWRQSDLAQLWDVTESGIRNLYPKITDVIQLSANRVLTQAPQIVPKKQMKPEIRWRTLSDEEVAALLEKGPILSHIAGM